MKVYMEIDARSLENKTWDCDEFWRVVSEQELYDDLDAYLEGAFSDDNETDLGHLNDVLRYEGDSVLSAIGADFHDTIWEDKYCKPKDSDGTEIEVGDHVEYNGGEWDVSEIENADAIWIMDDLNNEEKINPKDCTIL